MYEMDTGVDFFRNSTMVVMVCRLSCISQSEIWKLTSGSEKGFFSMT